MSILASEQISEQILIASIRGAIAITATLDKFTRERLSEVMRVTKASFNRLPSSFHLTEGKMTLKRLQHTSGGDLHAQEISPELTRSVQRDLKKRGVDFAVENGKDGRRYIHFKGADVDTISHAFKQVQARLDATLSHDKPQTRAELTATLNKKIAEQQTRTSPTTAPVRQKTREARS